MGSPEAASWLGVYSTTPPLNWVTHRSPAESNATPLGSPAFWITTAGDGLPVEASWLGVNSTMADSLATQRSPAPLNTASAAPSKLPSPSLEIVVDGATLPVALNGNCRRLSPL